MEFIDLKLSIENTKRTAQLQRYHGWQHTRLGIVALGVEVDPLKVDALNSGQNGRRQI